MRVTSWTTRALAVLLALAAPAAAERPILAGELPAELEGVGIVERLDERIPLDLTFVDDTGRTVQLAEYFQEGRPVLLTLNFYRCTMLCDLTLNGVLASISELDWSAGEEFEIVTVSIAPEEGPELAEVKKRSYLAQYRRATAAGGWHFLTGTKENIEALAKAVGFGYRRVETKDKDYDYAHTSSIMFLTPDGRLSRYMNDIEFDPKDMRLALVEASEGAIGSPMDKFLLFMCYHYDPEKGSYAASAVKLMRLGGAVTVIAIVAGLALLGLRGARGSRRDQGQVSLSGLQS